MADSNEQFERLEEKLLKAMNSSSERRPEKRALEQEIEKLKAATREHAQGNSAMERELIALRKEREDVRSRVRTAGAD